MPNTEKEETSPLLPRTGTGEGELEGETSGGTPFAAVCFAVIFFQTFVISGCDMVVRHENEKYFHINSAAYKPFLLGFAVFMYFVPTVVGIYADTYAGRYRTLVFGLGLKLTGSICGFIVIIVYESNIKISPIMADAQLCGFIFSIYLSVVGICFTAPTAITLGIQHVDQSQKGVASGCRWFLLVFLAGFIANDIAKIVVGKVTSDAENYQYYHTIHHAIYLAADILSIGLLLVNGNTCRTTCTESGQESFKELTHILKIHVLCFKRQPFDNTFWTAAERFREEMRTRRLERLKLRKGILMIAVLSCFAIISSMNYLLNQLFIMNPREWHGPYHIQKLNRESKNYATIVGILVIEFVAKKTGHHLGLESRNNQLRTIGAGSLLTILSLISAGVLSSCIISYGFNAVSIYWMIPQFVVMGCASIFIFTGGAVFFYRESQLGLETLVVTVAASLCFFSMAIEGIASNTTDIHHVVHYDTIYYVLAGIIAIVTLLALTPSAVWYLRADQAITNLEDAASPASSTLAITRPIRDGLNQQNQVSVRLVPYASD